MPPRKTVGAAPLLMGIVLASQSASTIVHSGPSLWSVPGLVGGCAAIIVGLGVLREWDAFQQEPTESNRVSATTLGIAVVAFLAGTVIAIT